MKLFIWVEPYRVSYGSSMLFAVASTEIEAKKLAEKGLAYKYGKYSQDDNFSVLEIKLGSPDRVVDLPCAEWHEWSA